MGVNEHGVVIGNEAVFSNGKEPKKGALLGMDLVRLGLERSQSAEEAVDVIVQLLELHGQGGNCGYEYPFYYDNAFLIADKQGVAFILETVGVDWVVQPVTDIGSISNAYSIGTQWTRCSAGLRINFGDSKFDFAAICSDKFKNYFSQGHLRRCRSSDLINAHRGKISPSTMFQVLRDHGDLGITRGMTGQTICMHASWGPAKHSQTTQSMVIHLRKDSPYVTVWITGTAAPCTSIFKPILGLSSLPESLKDGSFWWKHEEFHRDVLSKYSNSIDEIRSRVDQLESSFVQMESAAYKDASTNKSDLEGKCKELTTRCFEMSEKTITELKTNVSANASRIGTPIAYAYQWNSWNAKSKIPVKMRYSKVGILSALVLISAVSVAAFKLSKKFLQRE